MCFINLFDLLSLLIIRLGSHTYLWWNVQICSDSEKQIWHVAIASVKTQNASFALRGRLRSPSTHTSLLWAVSVLNSITSVLPVSDRSYERNNTPSTLSCLTPFAQHSVLRFIYVDMSPDSSFQLFSINSTLWMYHRC